MYSLDHNPFSSSGLFIGRGYPWLGKKEVQDIYIPKDNLDTHTYIVGRTGSGKTALLSLLASQLIAKGYGVMVIDLKGDPMLFNAVWVSACLAKRQDDFLLFSPASLEAGGFGEFPYGTCSYNPLMYGSAESITSKLTNASQEAGRAYTFHEEIKADFLFALVAGFVSRGKPFRFKDLWACTGSQKALRGLIKECRDSNIRLSLQMWLDMWTQNPTKYYQYTVTTKTFLRYFSTGIMGKLLNTTKPTLDLKEVFLKQKILYVCLPILLFEKTARPIAKMFLADVQYLTGYLQIYQKVKQPFAILIDEFENVIFESIVNIFNKARSAGICMFISHQSLADVSLQASRDMLNVLLDNTQTKIFFSQASVDGSEYLARRVGQDLAFFPMLSGIGTGMLRAQYDYLLRPEYLMTKNPAYPDGLGTLDFFALIGGNVYRGHTYIVPRMQIGRDIPIPHFEPGTDKQKGFMERYCSA